MIIDHHLKSCGGGTLSHGHCSGCITVSSAVSIAFVIIGIIPHPESYKVYAAGFKQCKETVHIQDLAVIVVKGHTALIKRKIRAYIRTHEEISGQVIDL